MYQTYVYFEQNTINILSTQCFEKQKTLNRYCLTAPIADSLVQYGEYSTYTNIG